MAEEIKEAIELEKSKEDQVAKFTEFESKYRVEAHDLIAFKKLVEAVPDRTFFLQINGPDHYFIKDGDNFARYRKPDDIHENSRSEVTIKVKPEGAKNNVIRKEINWRVDNTPEDAIREGLALMGYTYNFSIYKTCYIYGFADATVVFYTVFDITKEKTTKGDTFVEIEVNEELVHTLTEQQAWDIIIKYEKLLAPLGLTPQKRLRKSLFEMYKRNT